MTSEEFRNLMPGDTIWVINLALTGSLNNTVSYNSISTKKPAKCEVIKIEGAYVSYKYSFNKRGGYATGSLNFTRINSPSSSWSVYLTEEEAIAEWNRKISNFEDQITSDYEMRIGKIRKKRIL